MPEQKPGNLVLFRNKSTNPQAPVFKGFLTTPDGQRMEFALWPSEDKPEEKWKGKMKPEQPREEAPF